MTLNVIVDELPNLIVDELPSTHLIVHKELLVKHNGKKRQQEVLDRIAEVESSYSNVEYVPWDENDKNLCDTFSKIAASLAKKYSHVTLYGCSTSAGLEVLSGLLIQEGVSVSYDIDGTK